MSVAIRFENVSKQYRLGEVGTGTLSHDLHRAWAKLRGKPDPFAKVGAINDRTIKATSAEKRETRKSGLFSRIPSRNSQLATRNYEASGDYVWALRDINFEVQQGEILGIIGRNGAGKSTLLKLLSRVTAPTTGSIKAKGRIASLLEVGTGFHPELTGRENIYLNGAILGMRRHEITKQLEEIVEFSGCAKYIDTPVKRYSSGMTVRLGFAVAAHLDCEILVVDEVLAVGDAEFQKKCIGKMQEVSSGNGKTILFVSHNMSSVAALCKKAVLLQNGSVGAVGNTKDIVNNYIAINSANTSGEVRWLESDAPGNEGIALLKRVRIISDGEITADARLDRPFEIEADFRVIKETANITVSFHLNDKQGTCIFATANMTSAMLNPQGTESEPLRPGYHRVRCHIPASFLNADTYFVSAFLVKDAISIIGESTNCLSFTTHDTGEMRNEFLGTWIGMIRPKFAWTSEHLESSVV